MFLNVTIFLYDLRMKTLVTLLLAFLFCGAMAQSNLPACQGQVVGKWNNCFGSQTYNNGDKYVGEYKNGTRNGQGTETFANGQKYVGEYKNGARNGQGTFTFPNGDKYVGEYKNDKRNGQFTVTYNNGDTYVGEFKNDQKDGQGTYTFSDGRKYVGEYKGSRRNGQGVFLYANGKIGRSGVWKDGKLIQSKVIDIAIFERIPKPQLTTEVKAANLRAAKNLPACQGQVVGKWDNCFGSKTYASGNKYVGEYKNGTRNGQGTYTFANGDTYVGEFKDGKYSGQGTYTFANGDTYVGAYKNDRKDGQGTETFTNGREYVGEYKNGRRNGQFTVTYPSGDKYVGEYKNDKRDGQGTYTFADGRKYVGEHKNGKYSGRGILFGSNGTIKESGIFEKGKLVRSQNIDIAGFSQERGSDSASVAKKLSAENERLRAELEKERLRKEAEEARRINDALKARLARLQTENELLANSRPTSNASPAKSTPATTVMAKRRALVIGNNDYKNISKLENAVEDATAMAESLKKLGYQVDVHKNLGQRQFLRALRNFRANLKGGEEVLFFYAGHGIQLGNSNYLLPTDLGSDSAEQVRDESIELQRVLDDFAEQKTKFALAVIDACRDNPFKQSKRAIGGRGLAPTTAATGQMIMFSAGAGQQALDKLNKNDKSPNGLFTRVFLDEMNKPGVPVDQVLRSVRERVVSLAGSVGHEQVPALYDQAIGRFYFKPR
jgi:hypothetical protein